MAKRCWVCEEEKPSDYYCEECAMLLGVSASVCNDCCLCHLRNLDVSDSIEGRFDGSGAAKENRPGLDSPAGRSK
jgi:hypothetical protein